MVLNKVEICVLKASIRDDYDILLKAKADSEEYLKDEENDLELKKLLIDSMNTNY